MQIVNNIDNLHKRSAGIDDTAAWPRRIEERAVKVM